MDYSDRRHRHRRRAGVGVGVGMMLVVVVVLCCVVVTIRPTGGIFILGVGVCCGLDSATISTVHK